MCNFLKSDNYCEMEEVQISLGKKYMQDKIMKE